MKYLKLLLFLTIPMLSFGQASKLSMFDPLMGQIWKAEGKWGDGSKFMHEIRFEYALDSTIVIAKSVGYVDQAQTLIGQRSHGIRQYDKTSNSVRFWEYDVFGGLTKGRVTSQGKNVLYRYHYGETLVTDLWEYVNDTTYNFIVDSYSNGSWDQVYLSTQFKGVSSVIGSTCN